MLIVMPLWLYLLLLPAQLTLRLAAWSIRLTLRGCIHLATRGRQR